MSLQEKRIFCDKKEPDKNHLWLKPKSDREGYDLLYFSPRGWVPLICPCLSDSKNSTTTNEIIECDFYSMYET